MAIPNAFSPASAFPDMYMPGYTTNLDAYIRPLQEPLFDSDYVDGTSERIEFFDLQIGQSFAHGAERRTKGLWDTNLFVSHQICHPREFSILGFNILLEHGISEEDRAAILNDGILTFEFSGRRPYLTLPLLRMPPYEAPLIDDVVLFSKELAEFLTELRNNKTVISADETNRWIERSKEVAAKRSPLFKFNLGRAAIKIKPGEAFGVRWSWPKPPKVSRPIKVYQLIEGLHWSPL